MLEGLINHSIQLDVIFLLLLEIQLYDNCFTSLKRSSFWGLLRLKTVLFRWSHIAHIVVFTTTSKNFLCLCAMGSRSAMVKISRRFELLIPENCHHENTTFQVSMAMGHLTNKWSSLSMSLLQRGHLTVSRSIPRLSRLNLVGSLLFKTRQVRIFTFERSSLFYLVCWELLSLDMVEMSFRMLLTENLLEASYVNSQTSQSFERCKFTRRLMSSVCSFSSSSDRKFLL